MRKITGQVSECGVGARIEGRNDVELLRMRAGMLSGRDRVMMKMYLEKGNTFSEMAMLIGIHEANVARQIRKLTRRLMDGKYILCLRRREAFSTFQLEVAKDRFMSKLSIEKISAKNECSAYRVRQVLGEIDDMLATGEESGTVGLSGMH